MKREEQNFENSSLIAKITLK